MTEAQSAMRSGQKRLISSILDKGSNGITSEITLAECLVKPIRQKSETLIAIYLELLAEGSGLQIVKIDRAVLIEASSVRAKHHIKLPDAIHFATAQLAGCNNFVTNDHRLANLWGKNSIIWETL